ncbi:MAG: hypothetical protein ACNS62_14225 [Candidatus Cyclobacteriaceae bacterium M3_2C_046]
MEDAFWGDRTGKVKDPFGHCWQFATYQWEMTPDKMEQKQKPWMNSIQGSHA